MKKYGARKEGNSLQEVQQQEAQKELLKILLVVEDALPNLDGISLIVMALLSKKRNAFPR